MPFEIRLERESDHRAVEDMTREAFWNLHAPGCDEHLVAHQLRGCAAFLPALDFVAVHEGRVIGNVMATRARVVDDRGGTRELQLIGPLSVSPGWQRRGVGSALMRRALSALWEQGFGAVALYGNPKYYGRFGFGPAERFGIMTAEGRFHPALMAVELFPGALRGVSGRLFEDEAFQCDAAALEAFEKEFPPKEKFVTETQLAFRKFVESGVQS